MPRDPYPFPRLENDLSFAGAATRQVPPQNRHDTCAAQDEKPWSRLYQTQTLASSRREVFHFDPQAPNDSLDFTIKSVYDHHNEFLRSKANTFVQHETVGRPHGRVMKNRPGPRPPDIDMEKLPQRTSLSDKKESIHAINGAIECHHSAATNGGYSRKHDGGFYTT